MAFWCYNQRLHISYNETLVNSLIKGPIQILKATNNCCTINFICSLNGRALLQG